MRTYILLLLGVMTLNLNAQTTYIIDSTKRKLNADIDSLTSDLIFKLKNKNYDAHRLLSTQLIYHQKNADDTLPLFFKQEQIMAYFIRGEYKNILADAKDSAGSRFLENRRADARKKRAYGYLLSRHSRYFETFSELLEEVVKDKDSILGAMEKTDLNLAEKDFLHLYLRGIIGYQDLKHFDTLPNYHASNRYLITHQDTALKTLVTTQIHPHYKPKKIGVGINLYKEINSFTGGLSNQFQGSFIDDNYETFLNGFSLEFSFGKLHLENEFSGHTNYTTIQPHTVFLYKPNSSRDTPVIEYSWDIVFQQFERLNLSYTLLEDKEIRVAPFAGIFLNWIAISANGFDDFSKYRTQGLNFGVDFDWKLKYEKHYNTYSECYQNSADNSYWKLRLSVGISPVLFTDDKRFNGTTIYFKLGIGKFFQKTVK